MGERVVAVGRLAGNIAHDFNNILQVIVGRAVLLKEELPNGSDLQTHVSEILTAGQRGQVLVAQLQAYGRQQARQPNEVIVDELVGTIARNLAQDVAPPVALRVELQAPAQTVVADPGQLERVVASLVANAREAMRDGGTLTLRTSMIDATPAFREAHPFVRPGRYVCIEVSDTGHGIDSEILGRIFEPFFTTKESESGAGLGLATAYGIVKQSGGFILVESEPGMGTAFRVLLSPASMPGQTPASAAPIRATASKAPATGAVVLVVDDDDSVRRLLTSILKRDGHHVLEARNAGEAFVRCELFGGEIDLLVTDVSLPATSGQELAETLLAQYPAMRVLFVTGNADSLGDMPATRGAGVLEKPFGSATLSARARELLADTRAAVPSK